MCNQEKSARRAAAVAQITADLQAANPLWEAVLLTNQMHPDIPAWIQEVALEVSKKPGILDLTKARELLAKRTAELAGIPFEFALEYWAGMTGEAVPSSCPLVVEG